MSFHKAKPEHEVLYQDLVQLLRKHGDLPPHELLAIAGNMVGKLVAMQDQRRMTPQMALEIVAKNMEHGNEQILAQLQADKGSA